MNDLKKQFKDLRDWQLIPFAVMALLRVASLGNAWGLFTGFALKKAHPEATSRVNAENISVSHSINGFEVMITLKKGGVL